MKAIAENLYQRGKSGMKYCRRRIPAVLLEAYPPKKTHITQAAPDRASLYHVQASDLPELLPPSLVSYPVWYIRLPAHMRHAIAELAQSELGSYVGYTDNPWTRASYIYVACGRFDVYGGAAERLGAIPAAALELCADYVNPDIHVAAQKGCVIVIYECSGVLTLAGYPVTDETLTYLSIGETSTSFNPRRMVPWSELQARARAIEDTGVDPEAPDNGAVRIENVFDFRPESAADTARAAARLVQLSPKAPGASGHWMDSAGVGRLHKVVAFVPSELEQDQRIWMRITVNHELFELLQKQDGRAWVERLALVDCQGEAFVIFVRSGAEMALVIMRTDDARFSETYEAWAAEGSCALALENLYNGRLLSLRLSWPRDFTGDPAATAETAAEIRLRLSERALGDLLHEDAGVQEVVQRMAVNEGLFLNCGLSEAMDEVEWAVQSQLSW
ncbi:MAG: hypothetical protein EPN61_07660 [Burkholderiaceae bacterium]|nr:MAG: hypothetical protein EPN61_07660 [Burkholderiaceae bacterium]